ncbi:MAG: sigma-54 dependent transcriptional regulator [Myxococcota bacterium]
MASILVVEDESLLGRQLQRALQGAGHNAALAGSRAEALDAFATAEPDLALVDLRLPDASGLDVLRDLLERAPELPVLMMTAYGSVADAVQAMQQGAADYLQKPLDLDELRLAIDRTLERRRADRELAYHRRRGGSARGHVIGTDPRIAAIFEQIDRLADAKLAPGKRPTVLLTGETGTGKGLIARAVHEALGGGAFIELNCTGLPSTLVEEELFGHERGSFTGATGARAGLFEAADGGAIFLDEIGHLELGVQAKFLKVIEDKRVRRLGASRDRALDVHVIAATNADLDAAVADGAFRADLFHRLAVLAFEVPPLRERTQDIPALARHFCAELGHQYGRPGASFDGDAEKLLRQYPWPGNVRELRNVIERGLLLASGATIDASVLAPMLRAARGSEAAAGGRYVLPDGGIHIAELEADLIAQALERASGNRTQAAKLLGLTRDQLRYRMEKFEID